MATGDKVVRLDGLKAVSDHVQSQISDLKTNLTNAGLYSNVVDMAFVNGSVTVSSQALVYSEATTTCVTEEGKPFVVDPGAVIHPVDPATYKFRAWYGGNNGKWYVVSSSYGTSDMTVPSDKQRMYVIQVARNDGGAITPEELVGKFQIILPKRHGDLDGDFYRNFTIQEHLVLSGALTDSNGVASTNATYALSYFIPAKQGMTIATNLTSAGGDIITFYNAKLEYISGVASGTATATVPADGFVRFSGNAADVANYYAYFSNVNISDRVNQELKKINDTLTADVTMADYMQTAVARITAQLKGKSSIGNISVFGFDTDQHIKDEDDASRTLPVLRGLQVLSRLTREYPYDFICLGGDACDSGNYATTIDLILDECVTVQKPLYDAWCPVIPITGNHDAAQNNENITGEMMFNVHFRRIANSGFLSGWDNAHTNGYWDSEAHKIRFIFVDDTVRDDYGSTARNNALSSMLSGTPEGYNIVILSHHAMSQDLTDTKWQNPNACQSILAPYATRIICCICGHSHADVSETSAGILYIGTTAAMYGTDFDENTSTLNTETETAFDTFVIDQESKHIYAFRYGKGSDRDWTYTLT